MDVEDMESKEIFEKIIEILPSEMGTECHEKVDKMVSELDRRDAKAECNECGETKDASEIAIRQGICEDCVRDYEEKMERRRS